MFRSTKGKSKTEGHLKRNEFIRLKKYNCTECFYSCRDPNIFADHKMINHGATRPYYCDKCDEVFTSLISLSRHHLTNHSESKPHKCTSDKQHTGFKPY